MFVSLFYFSLWAIMRGANFVRPSALHRGYVNIWLFILGWAILVAITVLEDRFRISAGYIFVFLESAVFLSTLISLLELFSLPKMSDWGQQVREDHEARDHLHAVPHSEDLISPTPGESVSPAAHEEPQEDEDVVPADETTPLVGGNATRDNTRVTFATTYRRSLSAVVGAARKASAEKGEGPFEFEQPWSARLPSWTWWFQFLLLGPFIIILSAQIGLMLVDAVNQTGGDGSNPITGYIIIVVSVTLLLLPLSPFIHRITHHVPVFLLVVFIATLIYNLAAFPYSSNSRLVVYFQQAIDLDTGATVSRFHGLESYMRSIVDEIPSASGKEVTCVESKAAGTVDCSFDSSDLAPRLDGNLPEGVPPQKGYKDLVTYSITRGSGNTATFKIDAVDTKACWLDFDRPLSSFTVRGSSGWDERFGPYPSEGVGLIKLWRRNRTAPWIVDVEWSDPPPSDGTESHEAAEPAGELKQRDSGLPGRLVCQWSDANKQGTIPALDEAIKFAPTWTAVTKRSEALVEGTTRFIL